jgi:uncharacterized membrane protein
MKNSRTAILTIFVVLAVTLAIISTSAFIFGTSTAAASPSTTASGTNGYYPNGMMSNMMGGSWSQSSTSQTSTATQNTILPLIGFAALVGAAFTGTGGAVYYFKVPKNMMETPIAESTVNKLSQNTVTPYESVSKTLTTEERKVLGILAAHDGKYLQKYVRAETGLSRLKTHRIVSRLAERGIITLEKSGNTNEIHISNWLNEKPFSKINPKEKVEQEIVVDA